MSTEPSFHQAKICKILIWTPRTWGDLFGTMPNRSLLFIDFQYLTNLKIRCFKHDQLVVSQNAAKSPTLELTMKNYQIFTMRLILMIWCPSMTNVVSDNLAKSKILEPTKEYH